MKQIITEHRGRIKAIIKKLTGTYNEDIEQEVYIKTWQNLDKYQEQGKFSQWIGMITANLCRDYFRSRAWHEQNLSISDENISETTAVSAAQEEITDAKTRQKIILKAVDSLPKHLREVIYLFEFEEKTYEDIAKKTKVPIGTVKSRLFNARKILSEKLQFLKGE